MLEPSRPGRPKLPEWQLSQKSLANRGSLVRSYAKQLHCGHLIAEHAVKGSLHRDRLRARPATFVQSRDTLIAKFTTHDRCEDFIRARGNNDGNGQGVYRTGVSKLMQLLTADMGIATTPVSAYLDQSTALPLYLEFARAHGCLHDAVRTPQLCVYFDANEMYGRRKCQVLSVHLPQARQPHQLLLQVPLARYLDQADHITTSSQFESMDLLTALEKALKSGWGGKSMELVFSPDYAAYYQTTRTPPPTADCCSAECHGSKRLWKHPDWIQQPLRDFHNYPPRRAPFSRLIKCRPNSVYDVHHCNNHVLANGVIHPLWFWTRANLPEEYTV